MSHRRESTMTGARNMPNSAPEWYSVKELAQLFGTSKQTINKWLRTGEMNFLRREQTIRVPRSEVERFINANLANIAAKQAEMDAAQVSA